MVIFFLCFFEIFLRFKEFRETCCTDFINYIVEILRMKLFQEYFGKIVVKLSEVLEKSLFFAVLCCIVNRLSYSRTLYFKYGNLWSPLAPL